MNKLKDTIAKDLWVVLLDLIAVNLSYYLALIIRFYVNFQLRPVAVDRYLPAWMGFAPFYSVLAIVVFMAFRLYGGLWRYAGVNDMNRIILANLCTMVIHIAGTAAFFTRMPITYYVIGTVLQFTFVVIIRFSYRVLMVEKKKLRSRGLKKINTVVIGSGENGRRVVKNLEETESYRPVYVVGQSSGTMDGIPITTMEAVDWSDVGAVFIADSLLPTEERESIKKRCDEKDIELHDYTGYFSNLGGKLGLTELLAVLHSPLTLSIDGVDRDFDDGTKALAALTEKYEIKSIDAQNMKIKLERQKKLTTKEALAQAYEAVMGGEPPQ